jgi:hypothetical protein
MEGIPLEVEMAPNVIMRSWTGLKTLNVTELNIRVDVDLLSAGQYLILEHKDQSDGPDAHFVQVMRRPEGDYQLECRAGSESEHYQTFTTSADDVVAAFWGWSKGDASWGEKFEWTCIGDMFTNPERSSRIFE